MNNRASRIEDTLAFLVEMAVDPKAVATEICKTVEDIHTALHPVIGARGVSALYARSFLLTCLAHSWLTCTHNGIAKEIDAPALMSAFAGRSGVEAAAAGATLLKSFDKLLTSLIGTSLTDRLLRPVWDGHSSRRPDQDISP
jgi:hypothetical protein